MAFEEVENLESAEIDSVSTPPEAIEGMVVDAFVLEDVTKDVGVGIEIIPTLDLPPELPAWREGIGSRPATAEEFLSPKDGVGTAVSPEKAVDIESVAGSDGVIVAVGDNARRGISTG